MDSQNVLMALLRSVVCNERLAEDVLCACTEQIDQVIGLAHRHDLTHLVGQALGKEELPEEPALAQCKKAALGVFARYVQRNFSYTRICAALEEGKIPFLPLKGTVLRDFYPEPWMRNSCDTDILVHPEDLDRAVELLTQKLGYTARPRSDHDIALVGTDGNCLELHFDTIQERYDFSGCREVLGKIWDYAAPKTPDSCHYWLSDEMFYFYHMAHMAKHFSVGGCGVRAFLDIWVMNHRMPENRQARQELLEKGGLLKFALAAEKLSECWFSNAQPDKMDLALSDFILRAGLYGDNANRAAIGQARNGGKFKYLLTQRVFMPYEFMKDEYPILVKHKWLTPLYQVVRWVRMLCRGGLKKTVKELKANAKSGQEESVSAAALLKYMGV